MVERLGWTLVHFVWEGAVVAASLALGLLLTRRSTPGLRYGLALSALAFLATLPVVTFLALVPAPPSLVALGTFRAAAGDAILSGAIRSGASVEAKMTILVALWSLGVVVLSLRLVGSVLHLERWRRRHAWAAPDEEQKKLGTLASRLGMRRRVGLFLSDRLEVPSAWGVFRPVVVLPASLMTGLPAAQIEGILLHELAHVRRHDYLVNLIQGVVETALFYHPAVWWISSVVRREREHLCDDAAVAALGDPMPYARALLHLEERRQAPRPALSAKEGNLMNRIARILSPKPAPARLSPLAPSLAALAVVGLALGGVLRADAQASPSQKAGGTSTGATSKEIAARQAEVIARLDRAQSELAKAQLRLLQRANRAQVAAAEADRRAAKGRAKTKSTADATTRMRRAQEELAIVQARLQAEQGQIRTQIARAQAQADEARKRLDEARRPGASYGASGRAQHPLWSANAYPQGVGHLTTPSKSADDSARDWAEMQKAQAELAEAQGAQRTAILAAQGAAARAQVRAGYDMARAQQADSTRRDKLIAEAKAAQADAAKAWSEAIRNRESFIASSTATQARIDEAVKAAQANSAKDLQEALAKAREAQSRALNLQGTNDLFRNRTIDSAHSIFGLTAPAAGQGTKTFGLSGESLQRLRSLQSNKALQSLRQAGAPVRINALTLANDFSLFGEPKIEMGGHGKVSIDAKDTSFSAIVRALARKGKLSVVIERGMYRDVSLVVSDRSVADTLAILCRAADANLRSENGVYYVTPKKSATARGFGGGSSWGDAGNFGRTRS